MSELNSLINTTKRLLKTQGMTYRDVARALKLSEPTVKRMFATKRFTVERLMQIGALLGFTLAELSQEAAADEPKIKTLGVDQERALVSDTKLLLTAVCAINHWSMTEIIRTYRLTERECLRCLLQLDRMRVIDLLPGNRIRLVVARDFDWRPEGPIRQFFRGQGLDDFLHCRFDAAGDTMSFVHGMLDEAAFAQLQLEVLRLRKRFAELHEGCVSAPFERKHGASLLLASRRSWELPAFARLRRPPAR